jgi:hypothetical protein
MVKVLDSQKIPPPTGQEIGTFPQRTTPNPSQLNGANPPTLRPPAMRGHASDEVRAEFGKLENSQRAEITRAANAKS